MIPNVDTRLRRRRRTQSGSLFIDALVGLLIFSLGAAAFFSLMPALQQGEKISKYESLATQMAGRMIEHLQTLRSSQITAPILSDLNLVDAGQTGSPYSFTNVPMDQASLYSPSQALPDGTAVMVVENIDSKAVLITIDISWRSPSGRTKTLRSGTVIGGYK